MHRKQFLKSLAVLTILPVSWSQLPMGQSKQLSRVRPGDSNWPDKEKWHDLEIKVNGRLIKVDSPLEACKKGTQTGICSVFDKMKNPYYISHQPGLTQTLGWADAWTSSPSIYAIKAEKTADVVAGVKFAQAHNLRLVVKGGAHSYQGRSN
ncbi:MAG: hypothetical protein WD530_00670, partial [Vicingaceae bacterium]